MADSKPAAYEAIAEPPLLTRAAAHVRPNAKLIALLAAGHLVVDTTQGSLPAILPLLKGVHGLSYAQAATIVLTANVTSSIIQPVFGYLSDRTTRRWLLPASILVSGLGLAFIGVAPGYLTILALVAFMGLGIAAYHPEGFRTATTLAGDRKATALSWFALGGNVGIALGPPMITALIAAVGLAGTFGMLVPSVVAALVVLAALPLLSGGVAAQPAPATRGAVGGSADMPWAMALLVLVGTVRSCTLVGFATLVPFYYIEHLGADPRVVGLLLFVFLGSGALGTVVAGPIADRWGARPFIRWILPPAVPLGLLFLSSSGPSSFVVLGLLGAVLTSSFSVSVVLAQAYLPRHAGMATGLTVGLAVGLGGVGLTGLGWLADHHGLTTALWTTAFLPVIGFVAAQFLPRPRSAS